MNKLFIARQPILNDKNQIVAYELFYRGHDEEKKESYQDVKATLQVITKLLGSFGRANILYDNVGYINISTTFINDDLLQHIPKNYFVFELNDWRNLKLETILKLENYSRIGYKFSLGDAKLDKESMAKFSSLLRIIDSIKINIKENPISDYADEIKSLLGSSIKLIAERVESELDFFHCRNIGFHYFQGYFFARPSVIEQDDIDSSKYAILDILQTLQKDVDIDEIYQKIKFYPEVGIILLNFINSASFSLRREISSIRQMIALLGRKQIIKWLTLMLYRIDSNSESNDALIEHIRNRASTMVYLAKGMGVKKSEDLEKVEFIGLLSLLDVIFKQPIETILEKINTDQKIKDAILLKKNIAGKILALSIFLENGEIDKAMALAKKLNISEEILQESVLKTYLEVSDVEEVKADIESQKLKS